MNKLKIVATLVIASCAHCVQAQFAPQATLEGSDAIHKDDARIIDWASGVTYERGPMDISNPSIGTPTVGSETSPLGVADGDVLSLGDGGYAIVTFSHPIKNGPGADFAVFENGFGNPVDPSLAYLEFAYVSVSSDGENFFQFEPVCNIPDSAQVDNFTYIDATLIHNLAGKYIVHYGTPFDLEELKGKPGLDVDRITHVKVTDVIGSIDPEYAQTDSKGNIINDPYPSIYPSCGFDLDAVAVLHNTNPLNIEQINAHHSVGIYPNPSADIIYVTSSLSIGNYSIMNLVGKKVAHGRLNNNNTINIQELYPGVYFLDLQTEKGNTVLKFVKQ
jgi:hypothetical protein